ncbi:SEL1 protein [Nematocida minor]|uniref:SEL1 protein n=1 Tax=Nematocida minor TaxID=1912983 RepID=UPI00221F5CD5|nr:SEL1 protein [Nematocida minor]KAI5192932.1 SEL1 protein [Nematocida minor]
MFRGAVVGFLLFAGIFATQMETKEGQKTDGLCEHGCHKVFESLFVKTDIKKAKEEIDSMEGQCKYFYKWFTSTYFDFNIKEGVESLYRSLYSTCEVKDLAYLVYASKIDRRHNIIGDAKDAIFYYREIAKLVFQEFFRKRITLFAKWEFANLEKQGENKKIINFIKTLTNSGDSVAAENLLSLIKIGHVELEPHIDFLKESARKGSADAMGILGNMYYYGWGVTPSRITARHYYAEGAKSNDPDCLNGLGMLHIEEGNKTKGKVFLEKASAMGSQAADYNLYLMYESANNFMGDLHLIKAAKQEGYLPAVYQYAEKSRKKKEYKSTTVSQYKSIAVYHSKVLELEKMAIEKCKNHENAEAFYLSLLIGDMGSKTGYMNAAYILKNRVINSSAMQHYKLPWFNKAKELLGLAPKDKQKEPMAQRYDDSEKSDTVPENTDSRDTAGSTAIKSGIHHPEMLYILLCRRIAEMDSSEAAIELGNAYFYSVGVEKNLEKAFSRYYTASLMKDPEGDYLVGWMYETGSGVSQSYSLAREFYTQMYKRKDTTYLLYWVLMARVFLKMHIAKIVSLVAVGVSVFLGWITIPQAALLFSRRRSLDASLQGKSK